MQFACYGTKTEGGYGAWTQVLWLLVVSSLSPPAQHCGCCHTLPPFSPTASLLAFFVPPQTSLQEDRPSVSFFLLYTSFAQTAGAQERTQASKPDAERWRKGEVQLGEEEEAGQALQWG